MSEKKYSVKQKFNDCQINDSSTGKGAIVLSEATQKELKRLYDAGHTNMITAK